VCSSDLLAGTSIGINNVSGDLVIGADVRINGTVGVTIPPGTKITGGNLTTTIEFNKEVTIVNPTALAISYTGIVDTGTTGLNIVNGGNGLYQSGYIITITGGDGTATFIAGTSTGGILNGVTNSDTGEDFTRPFNLVTNNREFTFKYLQPLSGNTAENGRYSLGWYCTTGGVGNSAVRYFK